MEQIGSFRIGKPSVKYSAYAGGVVNKYRAAGLADNPFDVHTFPPGPPETVQQMFICQAGGITGKSFIQPDIFPAAQSDVIAEPLVGQFMNDQLKSETAHEAHGLVFHTSSPAKLRMAVFFV